MAPIVLDNFCPNHGSVGSLLTYRDIWVDRLKRPTVYIKLICNLSPKLGKGKERQEEIMNE